MLSLEPHIGPEFTPAGSLALGEFQDGRLVADTHQIRFLQAVLQPTESILVSYKGECPALQLAGWIHEMSSAYGVFEGGGVKGIALVGALARFQMEDVRFRGYAGSSAGAIVAALAAAGYPAVHARPQGFPDPGPPDISKPEGRNNPAPHSLKHIMCSMDYMKFIGNDGGAGPINLARLRGQVGELKGLLPRLKLAATDFESLRYYRPWDYVRFYLKYKSLSVGLSRFREASDVLFDRLGFYSTDYFVAWVRWHLEARGDRDKNGNVTFGSLERAGTILKVLASDLRDKRIEVFDPLRWAGMDVALAVQASMSIPIFFRPYPNGNSYLVDGGLLSNFPAWVFDAEVKQRKGKLPIIGFRLIAPKMPESPIDSFESYARALYETALEGTDELQVRRVEGLIPVMITTPVDVSATKFDLEPRDRLELWVSGVRAADQVLNDPSVRNALGLPDVIPPLPPDLLEL